MGAVIAIASILGLLYVKHATAAAAAGGSTAGGALTSANITGAPDPNSAFDTKAPSQGEPIGNTHLSITDPVYSASGEIVGLPYRPSDPAYGGGIQSLADVETDPYSAGSPGSGVGAIEQINAPHARPGIHGGVTGSYVISSRLPVAPRWNRGTPRPPARAGDSGAGSLPIAPPTRGPAARHPANPLRPTITLTHQGTASHGFQFASSATTTANKANAVVAVKPAAAPARKVAAGSRWFTRA
jgi:hypothetical protein